MLLKEKVNCIWLYEVLSEQHQKQIEKVLEQQQQENGIQVSMSCVYFAVQHHGKYSCLLDPSG
jgi:hypothetical protein